MTLADIDKLWQYWSTKVITAILVLVQVWMLVPTETQTELLTAYPILKFWPPVALAVWAYVRQKPQGIDKPIEPEQPTPKA